MNMFSKKWKVLSDFKKSLSKPLYKNGDKCECGNYLRTSLVSIGRKLLSILTISALTGAEDKVLKEELYGFRKREDTSTKFSLLGK